MTPSKRFRITLLIRSLVMLTVSQAQGDSLEKLADDFCVARKIRAIHTR